MSAIPVMPLPVHCGGVLIASPSTVVREQVVQRMNGRCHPVQQVVGGADALAKLEKGEWQVLFLDRRLPDLDAEELLPMIHNRFPGLHVVMLDSDVSKAAASEEAKPEFPAMDAEPVCRRPRIESSDAALPGMIGSSEAMRRVYRLVRLVAGRTNTVLIEGPTGTGKELIAQAIHALSRRASKPFVVVNCAAIPEALLESELFGFTRGAFTGAVQSQIGRISAAQGGTLFLDEIGELPLGMQAKLLRFLEQKEVQRLGTFEVTRVDVRVIAATNLELSQRVAKLQFREDLYYRLSAFPIELPSLSERKGDIIPLAEHFLTCMAAALHLPAQKLAREAMNILEEHTWRGNIRELQHVMERASILAGDGQTIEACHIYFADGLPEKSA